MLTEERTKILVDCFNENGNELIEMSPEDALEKINADGHDFTLDELSEFAKAVSDLASDDEELDAEKLDSVTGGISFKTALKALKFGIDLGNSINRKRFGKNYINCPW